MQEVIAGLEQFTFLFEKDVEMQRGIRLLPFQGMDRKLCPFRHDRGEKMVVCKHWLRGLCKKGDGCKFLHQYDVTRMPECYFYSKFGDCNNKECPFLHTDPASKTRTCLWYDQGFCKDGPLCKYPHVRKKMCINYLAGFCSEGPKCQFAHPKMDIFFKPRSTKLVNWPQGRAPPAPAWEPWKPSPLSEHLFPHFQTKPEDRLGLRAPERHWCTTGECPGDTQATLCP